MIDKIISRCRTVEKPGQGEPGEVLFARDAIRSLTRLRLGWAVAASLTLTILAVIGGYYVGLRGGSQPPPKFQRLTFRRGVIRAARFAPDGKTIYYGAAWEGDQTHVFSVRPVSPEFHATVVPNASPLSVSASGEMTLLLKPRLGAFGAEMTGTLARLSSSGGAPWEWRKDVQWADWAPNGQMAIVRYGEKGSQLEFPEGKVLFNSTGYVSHPRFSPAGDRIAFLHHPRRGNDAGEVIVVSPAGEKKILSTNWGSARGLAWAPKTNEIWFTAGNSNRDLQAVTLTGAVRTILTQTASLTLEDISRDGQVLLSSIIARNKLQVAGPGGKNAQDLSWLDWSQVNDIATDGRIILFSESGEGAGSGQHESIYYRGTDGSPAIRLGIMSAPRLSADGKSVVAINQEQNGLVVFPLRAGESRHIPLPGFQINSVAWLPDGCGILFNGSEGEHGPRVYSLELSGGKPVAITPEGTRGMRVSPGGKFVAVRARDRRVLLYPLAGGDPVVCPGIEPGEYVVSWSSDESSLFVRRMLVQPARVYRVDWKTGSRELWKEIVPPDPAGVEAINTIVVTPDGRFCAYSYIQTLSDLYLVEGLQ